MASTSQTAVVRPSSTLTGRNGLIEKYFYFAMSLLVVAIVASGFGQTVNGNLFHPSIPRPFILWIHAAAFTGWVLFFVMQSALIRSHNVRLHRSLGWFGAALGTAMVPLGITTAIIMKSFEVHQLHKPNAALFLSIPFNAILCFGTFFALAVYWRKKPELHRRFIFIATAVLLSAAFARFRYLADNLFYPCVDAVILLGVLRDFLVNRRVHMIYRIALPALVVAQVTATYLFLAKPAWWVRVAHAIAG